MAKRGKAPRAQVPLRIPEALRARIETAAKDAGKSMNAEIVERLEKSFDFEDRLGGPDLVDLIETVAKIMKQTGELAGHYESGKSAKYGKWLAMPYAFNQAASAANVALEFSRPPGKIVLPTSAIHRMAALEEGQLPPLPPQMREMFIKLGKLTAVHELQNKDEENE